jgi:hypothetical protein
MPELISLPDSEDEIDESREMSDSECILFARLSSRGLIRSEEAILYERVRQLVHSSSPAVNPVGTLRNTRVERVWKIAEEVYQLDIDRVEVHK